MTAYLFPLTTTLEPVAGGPALTGTVVPPFTAAYVILTATTLGALTLAPGPSGAPVTIPAGTGPRVIKLAGSTGTNMTAIVANPADAAIASLAIQTWEPLHGPAMSPAEAAASPYAIPTPPTRGTAVFLNGPQGSISGSSIASGSIAISGATSAALTLRASGGWQQIVPANSTGVTPLTGGPTGPSVTWNFTNPSDAYACDIVVAITA